MTTPSNHTEYSPYPRLTSVKKNLEYAKLLMDDYAGRDSELSAITQYIYQHFTQDALNKEVAQTVLTIARAEMKHLELLGEAISKLGGNPVFQGGTDKHSSFWNGSYPNYSMATEEALEANIQAETTAIQNYTRHAEMIDDPEIKNLLKRIIRDEESHLMIYTNLLNRISKNK